MIPANMAIVLMMAGFVGVPLALQMTGFPVSQESWVQIIGGLVTATVIITALRGKLDVLRLELKTGLDKVLYEAKDDSRKRIDHHVEQYHAPHLTPPHG